MDNNIFVISFANIFPLSRLSFLPGASTGVPTHDKGHAERPDMQRRVRTRVPPPLGSAWASTPKPESVCFTILQLSPTPLTLTGGYLWPPFSEGNQLRALVIIGVFQSKPLRWLSNLPDRFTRTPTATHTIVYSLPTSRGMGSLRYLNSIQPLGELEIVRTELVEDYIVEPMFAAKFPHPLYCILGSILINIVGI